MKLILDEHYANEVAAGLRAGGFDVVAVAERGLLGIEDEALLALAASERRALLTNNVRHLIPIASSWVASGREHCGLVCTSDSSMPRNKHTTGVYIETLRAFMSANPNERALANQIRWL